MTFNPKAPPVYKPTSQKVAAPPIYRPQPANHSSTQRKPAANFRTETRPAPPVYRPQQANSAVLAKPPAIHPPAPWGRTLHPSKEIPPVSANIATAQRSMPPANLPVIWRMNHVLSKPAHAAQPRVATNQPRFQQAGHHVVPAIQTRSQSPTIQRAFLVNAVWNYFFPPPQVLQPPPQPTAEERHQRLVARSGRHFRETGRPLYSELTEKYPNSLDRGKWDTLTHIHGRASNIKKRTRDGPATHGLVKELLDNFVSYGFGYRLMEGMSGGLLDTEYSKDAANGNCFAYAKAFADILNSFGIEAESREVRSEDQGRFIVKLSRFIDSTVPGHIYVKGVLQQGYYVFTSHVATWVEATQRFYDPMATISYTSLDPYIECELDSDKNQVVYTPSTQPKTLCTGYQWKLIRRDQTVPGGFRRLDLVPLKKKT